jgi:hypothetical protein
MIKIGALWQKKDKRGSTMFSGEMECPHCKKKTRVFGFINKYKTAENKQPNFNLFMPDDMPQESQQSQDEPYMPEKDEPKVEQSVEEDNEEEMPF